MSLSDVDGRCCWRKLHRRLAEDEDQSIQQSLKKVIDILLWLVATKIMLN